MDKLFMKDLPPTSSWMTFSGEGEYDHMEFIDWVDRLKTDFHMKDALVTSKLNIVLTGLARIWFIELRREGPLTWEGWKEAMISRFGTEMWRNNMQRAFDRDRFRPMVNTEPVQWLCKQRRRLEAANPEISRYRMITQILSKCPPDLSHAVQV